MEPKFSIGDILYFHKYCFTDTGEYKPHYALILLPSDVLDEFETQVLCSVITSKRPSNYYVPLDEKKYQCFQQTSYACFDRRDLNSKRDLDSNFQQPVGQLDEHDFKNGLKIIHKIQAIHHDKYYIPVILREWKIENRRRKASSPK